MFQLILKQCFLSSENPHLLNTDDFIETITKAIDLDLLKANLNQLFSIYFMAGYYYKVFLNQNEVTIKRNNKEEQ